MTDSTTQPAVSVPIPDVSAPYVDVSVRLVDDSGCAIFVSVRLVDVSARVIDDVLVGYRVRHGADANDEVRYVFKFETHGDENGTLGVVNVGYRDAHEADGHVGVDHWLVGTSRCDGDQGGGHRRPTLVGLRCAQPASPVAARSASGPTSNALTESARAAVFLRLPHLPPVHVRHRR